MLEEFLRRHDGVLTHEQARTAGISQDAINRRVRSDRWLRCSPGVYFVDDRPFTDAARVRAAVWGFGDHAVASGLAAAWWFFEELERRKAVVFIHPTTIPPGADATGLKIPYGVTEFTFDTTRCVTDLLYSGTLERYPSIRYIVSHAGGTVPYLAWRIAGAAYLPELREHAPKDPMALLKGLYYDTALSTSEFVFGALREFVPTSRVLFGSDFPYISDGLIAAETAALDGSAVLDDAARKAINRENALALFPNFAATCRLQRS